MLKSLFPPSLAVTAEIAQTLYAQSAGAELVRPLEKRGVDVFSLLASDTPFRRRYWRNYVRNIWGYFREIRRHLPNADTLLDVGCGPAVLTFFVARHVGARDVYLLDRSIDLAKLRERGRARGGFHDEYVFTAALLAAKELLLKNGFSANIHLCEVGSWEFPRSAIDLVISRRSWGFHYPIETYRDQVCQALRPEGVAITDNRKGTGGENVLSEAFGDYEIVVDAPKLLTVKVVRRP